jgi:hypothetical protein
MFAKKTRSYELAMQSFVFETLRHFVPGAGWSTHDIKPSDAQRRAATGDPHSPKAMNKEKHRSGLRVLD